MIQILSNGDGGRMMESKFVPVHTDLPPAPENLLKMIQCNCRTDCSSMRCACRKPNVKCSPACGNCRGSDCTNSTILEQFRLKNYYWPLAVFRTKLSNGQPLSKVVGPLGRPTEKYVNSQTHTEICYGMAVFQYYDIVVSIVANSNEKCIM